ncbi:unnamed protein product [Closterium sp. Yama58-4]|nr:unnamed protein product [Closterium sp. Yama58-4]
MAQARASPSGAHLSYSTPPSPLSLDGLPHSLEGRVSNPPHAPTLQGAGVAEAAELTAALGAMGGDEEMAEEGSCEGGRGLEWRRVVAMLMSDTKHAMTTVDSVMGGQGGQDEQQQQQQQQHHDEMRNQQLSYQHIGMHQEQTHYYQADNNIHDDHEKQHPGQRLGTDTAQCHHRNWQATPSASSPLKLVIPIPRHHGETRSAANTTAAHVGDGLTAHQFQSPCRQLQRSPAATPVFSNPVRDAPLPYDPVEIASDGKPRRVPLRHCERSQPPRLSLTEARPHDLLGSEQPAPEGWRSKSKRRAETMGSPRVQIPSRGVQMVSPGDGIASPAGLTSSPGVRMATSPGLQSPPTILLDDMSARSGRSATKRRRGHSGSWEARGSSASPGGNRAVVAEEERPAVTASPAATATPFEGPDWLHHLHSGKLQTLPIMLRMETTKDRISLLRQLVAPALTKGDTATVLGEVEQFVRAVYEKLKEISNGHEQHATFPAKENAGESAGIDLSRVVRLSDKEPRAFLYKSFLSDDECDHIVNIATARLARSAVADSSSGQSVVSGVRTSTGMFLTKGEDDVIRAIEQRVSEWTFLPVANQEALQVLRYAIGQKYDAHLDYFSDPVNTQLGGHRYATVLMYLSNVTKGGETVFPTVKDDTPKDDSWSDCAKGALAVKPCSSSTCIQTARLTLPRCTTRALYGGGSSGGGGEGSNCPVVEGIKWSAPKWIRMGDVTVALDNAATPACQDSNAYGGGSSGGCGEGSASSVVEGIKWSAPKWIDMGDVTVPLDNAATPACQDSNA